MLIASLLMFSQKTYLSLHGKPSQSIYIAQQYGREQIDSYGLVELNMKSELASGIGSTFVLMFDKRPGRAPTRGFSSSSSSPMSSSSSSRSSTQPPLLPSVTPLPREFNRPRVYRQPSVT